MGSGHSAVIAIGLGFVLALVLLVPWAAHQYRKRGTVGIGAAVVAFATVVYALALVTYTLLPLPANIEALCRDGGVGAQLQPLAFLADIRREGGVSGPASLLRNPASAQLLFNILLFIPLGMIVRYSFVRGRFLAGVAVAGVTGLAVSLAIEFTQLTGDWFLYPCAYRLFDVDDLAANTVGALLGALCAPVLALIPWQYRDGVPSAPRPVTAGRRFLGMACDLLSIWLLAGALVTLFNLVVMARGGELQAPSVVAWTSAIGFLPAVLQLVLVLVFGRTVGEMVVRLRPATSPSLGQRITRWAVGVGGWSVLSQIDWGPAGIVAFILAVAAVAGVWTTRGRRGFAYFAARLRLEDDRAGDRFSQRRGSAGSLSGD